MAAVFANAAPCAATVQGDPAFNSKGFIAATAGPLRSRPAFTPVNNPLSMHTSGIHSMAASFGSSPPRSPLQVGSQIPMTTIGAGWVRNCSPKRDVSPLQVSPSASGWLASQLQSNCFVDSEQGTGNQQRCQHTHVAPETTLSNLSPPRDSRAGSCSGLDGSLLSTDCASEDMEFQFPRRVFPPPRRRAASIQIQQPPPLKLPQRSDNYGYASPRSSRSFTPGSRSTSCPVVFNDGCVLNEHLQGGDGPLSALSSTRSSSLRTATLDTGIPVFGRGGVAAFSAIDTPPPTRATSPTYRILSPTGSMSSYATKSPRVVQNAQSPRTQSPQIIFRGLPQSYANIHCVSSRSPRSTSGFSSRRSPSPPIFPSVGSESGCGNSSHTATPRVVPAASGVDVSERHLADAVSEAQEIPSNSPSSNSPCQSQRTAPPHSTRTEPNLCSSRTEPRCFDTPPSPPPKQDVFRRLLMASKYMWEHPSDCDSQVQTRAVEKSLRHYAGECFDSLFDGVERDASKRLEFDQVEACTRLMNEHLRIGNFKSDSVERCCRCFDPHGDRTLSRSDFQKLYRMLFWIQLNDIELAPFSFDFFSGRRPGKLEDHYEVVESKEELIPQACAGTLRRVVNRSSGRGFNMRSLEMSELRNSGLPLQIIAEDLEKLKVLEHPAILSVLEYFLDSQSLKIISDEQVGTELPSALVEAHARRKPFGEQWIQQMFVQVCEGIAYIHTKGVMHQNLSLGSIILSSISPPEPFVVDSGMAALFPLDKACCSRPAKPPPGYVATKAPEVFQGKCSYKSDVWSLGCCLFALLSRTIASRSSSAHATSEVFTYPFEDPSESDKDLSMHLQQLRRGPDMVMLLRETKSHSQAKDLILLMLQFASEKRPAMTKVVAHSWFRQLADLCPSLTTQRCAQKRQHAPSSPSGCGSGKDASENASPLRKKNAAAVQRLRAAAKHTK